MKEPATVVQGITTVNLLEVMFDIATESETKENEFNYSFISPKQI